MKNNILHKEILNYSQHSKLWVISISLLLNFIYHSIMFYSFEEDILPNKNFSTDDFIAISVILLIISIIGLLLVFLRELKIVISYTGIILKNKGMKEILLDKNTVQSYAAIGKKEYYKLSSKSQKGFLRKKRRLKNNNRNFFINIPNFAITLIDGRIIFIQTKKRESFEEALNKMLNLRYV